MPNYQTIYLCDANPSEYYGINWNIPGIDRLLIASPAISESQWGFDSCPEGKRLFYSIAKDQFSLDCVNRKFVALKPTHESGVFDTFYESVGPIKWGRYVSFTSSSTDQETIERLCDSWGKVEPHDFHESLAKGLEFSDSIFDWSDRHYVRILTRSPETIREDMSNLALASNFKLNEIESIEKMPQY